MIRDNTNNILTNNWLALQETYSQLQALLCVTTYSQAEIPRKFYPGKEQIKPHLPKSPTNIYILSKYNTHMGSQEGLFIALFFVHALT